MDMRDLEAEVQRLVGYNCFVTSGVVAKGPYLNFNAKQRLLRIWIPREGTDAKRVAEIVKGYMAEEKESAYKEIEYTAGAS
jgi:hypothetical protein